MWSWEEKWWDERRSTVSFRHHIPLNAQSAPAAPSAQCWTRTWYMLLMIELMCLQPSGVYAWSKHSDHAKIDSLEWGCESWGTAHVQQDYVILSLWTCETEGDCFVSHKSNTNFYSWKCFKLGISQLKLKTQFGATFVCRVKAFKSVCLSWITEVKFE